MFEQERVIGRLQRRVLAEASVRASFLAGSHGAHTEDEFSDLDVVLVYADQISREAAWRERREFVQSVMPYVAVKSFDAQHIRPFFHVALFSNGCKIDMRYETQASLTPEPWHAQIRILKESQGWAEQHQAASARQPLPQPRLTADELVALDNRFWVIYWDVLRVLRRGDADKPFAIYLDLLNFTFQPLLRVLPANDAARQELLVADYSRETAVTLTHMRHVLEAYLAARSAVIQRYSLAFMPDRAFERELGRLVERLT